MKRIIAIVGPTGIGKSRLALYLAKIFHGEIVSADSRQVIVIWTSAPLNLRRRSLTLFHII